MRDDRTVAGAYEALKKAQKPSYGAPAYSRWVNRPVGRGFAAFAYRVGLTPNGVTAISAAFTFSAILLVAVMDPSTSVAILVALLLAIGYALDSADGQVARLTGLGSPAGEWLDHVVDMGKTCLLHGAVILSWYQFGLAGSPANAALLAIPVAFLAVNVVSFFGWLLSDLLIRLSAARRGAQVARTEPAGVSARASAIRSLLRLPTDYGLLAVSFALLATPLFAWAYSAMFLASLVVMLAALPVWFRQVKAAGSAPANNTAADVMA